MSAHQKLTPQSAQDVTAKSNVVRFPSASADLPMSVVTQAALALPPLQQLELIRLLTGEFTYSYGADEIDRGVDMILIDIRDDAELALGVRS